MGRLVRPSLVWLWCVTALIAAFTLRAAPPDIRWDASKKEFSASVQGQPLIDVLAQMATQTGWHIFVEPDSNPPVTTEFKEEPVGRGIELLVGKMNYALVPQRDAPSKLFVFHTTRDHATIRIQKPEETAADHQAKRVPNELIVTVKPGTDIEALAKQLGAKVVGQIEGTDTYRLRFEDEDATEKARTSLASNEDVTGVENNYYVKRPTSPQPLAQSSLPPLNLSLNPPPANGRLVVGLVDTAVQSLGKDLDQFILSSKSTTDSTSSSSGEPTHGTSMAETILRSIQMASDGSTSVQILPEDVYGSNAQTTSFDVAAGIISAVNGGANIINLSLGSYEGSGFLEQVIQSVVDKGIPVFAAAGNEPVTYPVYPAAYSDVIAVTAAQGNQLAPYANYGDFVDMAAPGSTVVYFGGKAYVVNGTSSATAYASGLAAAIAETQKLPPTDAAKSVSSRLAVTFSSGK